MPKRRVPDPLTLETWKAWRGKPVAVYWEDATFHEDPGENFVNPAIAITVGFLDEWDENKLRLVGEAFPEENGKRRVTAIPHKMIQHVSPWSGFKVPDKIAVIIAKAVSGLLGATFAR